MQRKVRLFYKNNINIGEKSDSTDFNSDKFEISRLLSDGIFGPAAGFLFFGALALSGIFRYILKLDEGR